VTQRDLDRPLTEILAERGRPVSADGLERARTRLSEADERRDPVARAELVERLRAAAA